MNKKEAIAILKEGAKHYCEDIASCEECDRVICVAKIDEAINVVEEDARPQGEWIFDGWGTYCSECGYRPKIGCGKFCSECGAKMKGGAE